MVPQNLPGELPKEVARPRLGDPRKLLEVSYKREVNGHRQKLSLRLRLTLMLSIAEVEAVALATATGASVDITLVGWEAMADMEATADSVVVASELAVGLRPNLRLRFT